MVAMRRVWPTNKHERPSTTRAREGDPYSMGDLTRNPTLTEDDEHATNLLREALQEDLAESFNRQRVWLHVDDGVEHNMWPFVVTDIDPDLLEPPG